MPFTIRQFSHDQTLGEKLHSLRMAAHLTLSELESKTKIQKKYLKAFEDGAYNKLPDPIYTRNYLKQIVQSLGDDATYFLDRFEQERVTCDYLKGNQTPRQRASALSLFSTGRFYKIFLFSASALFLVLYLGLQVKTIVSAPKLSISYPVDGYLSTDATVKVKGETDKGSALTINGEQVLLSEDGSFEKEVSLERGLNVLTIEGSKRYSHKAAAYRRVVFDQLNPISQATPVDKSSKAIQ